MTGKAGGRVLKKAKFEYYGDLDIRSFYLFSLGCFYKIGFRLCNVSGSRRTHLMISDSLVECSRF